jgi:TPR repeat protein
MVRTKPALDGRVWKGEADMARFELNDCDQAVLGEAPASADTFFQLGMMYSSGRSVPIDYITAHKWFNLAALKGNEDAIRLRREIAAEMSEAEIASAQRAARDWMRTGASLLAA